jgi:hypothetical protein
MLCEKLVPTELMKSANVAPPGSVPAMVAGATSLVAHGGGQSRRAD